MKVSCFKEEIKDLYIKGLNASEITNILNAKILDKDKKLKRESVQKHIQRNLSHKKMEHNLKIIEKREVLKAINYEATRCMSDKAFINKNKSIYVTRPNGDIVINKEVAPVTTWDTPKRLVNENKVS